MIIKENLEEKGWNKLSEKTFKEVWDNKKEKKLEKYI